jgi:hypothetical protein
MMRRRGDEVEEDVAHGFLVRIVRVGLTAETGQF